MRRAFTLIELLVICAILATMVSIGVGSILSGQGTARVKGATRDVYAAIRHARSVALVTGQRVVVNYSNEKIDDETCVKVEIVAAKIMSAEPGGVKPQPYWIEDYKDVPRALQAGGETGEGDAGETIEEILFSPMDASIVKGMRVLVKKGDEALKDETTEQKRSRISMFSNVDYLQSRYKEAKKEAEAKKASESGGDGSGKDSASPLGGSVNDMDGPWSVVWETNGAVEPHKIWIYPDGKKPEDGLMLNIDQFGGIKVVDGDGREED